MNQTSTETPAGPEQATGRAKPAGRKSLIGGKRCRRQSAVWWILPAVIIAGWWYPIVGFFVPLCMLAAWGIAVRRGRSWCDWMCPRGAFNDCVVSKISRKSKVPAFLRSTGFRLFVLAVMMTVLIIRLPQAWPNPQRIGMVFVLLLTVTTGVAIILGVIFHQRTWCMICPAGTIAKWIGRARPPYLQIKNDLCTECKRCSKVCPLQLRPFAERAKGMVTDADCMKCGLCVEACPTGALALKSSQKE